MLTGKNEGSIRRNDIIILNRKKIQAIIPTITFENCKAQAKLVNEEKQKYIETIN